MLLRLTCRCPGRPAFVLIEVLLAVAVTSIGILGLFALLHGGLRRADRADRETEAALFADGVLAGLRAASVQAAEADRWLDLWRDLAAGATNLPPVAGPGFAWIDDQALAVEAGVVATNIYRNWGLHVAEDTDLVDHALRYRLDVAVRTNRHGAVWRTNRVDVSLAVWPGRSGPTNARNALLFHAAYRDGGRL